MASRPINQKSTFQLAAYLLIFTLLFAIAYSQSPLYTSNQNQYFLHGFAAAGIGNLDEDWLANTRDPTPVFSKLVELTLRYLHLESFFYVWYALLIGVYIVSLYGIADLLFDLRSSRFNCLTFSSVFIAAHSAGLRFALSSWLGPNWTYLLEDGVADQRMLGLVFQPSTFGVFLALALFLFMRGRPYLAALSAAIAATFHPTYLLVAAILMMGFALSDWIIEKNTSKPVGYGLLALILVSPILAYVATSFSSSSPEMAAQARHILVNFRIPHHALVSQWLDATVLVKLGLLVVALSLLLRMRGDVPRASRASRLAIVLSSTALIAILLTLAKALSGNHALALLFPWRISTLLVPLSTTLIIAFSAEQLGKVVKARSAAIQRLTTLACMSVIFLSALTGGLRFMIDLQRREAAPERNLEAFIHVHKSPDDVYLIPLKMQDFRLESGAPAFVDFKSIPYRDADVLEWRRRVRVTDQFYASPDCEQLVMIIRQEGITHVVMPTEMALPACQAMHLVYLDDAYRLLRYKP